MWNAQTKKSHKLEKVCGLCKQNMELIRNLDQTPSLRPKMSALGHGYTNGVLTRLCCGRMGEIIVIVLAP
jgi:hypothetical protein